MATTTLEHLLLDITVAGTPQPKLRARRAAHGRWYTPRPSLQAEQRMREAARSAWAGHYMKPYLGQVAVELVFWLPTKRRLDLDNLVKLVTDALMPDVLKDDSQISSLGARKAYSSTEPRTELQLYALGPNDVEESGVVMRDTPSR